jgi:hypothetical protein
VARTDCGPSGRELIAAQRQIVAIPKGLSARAQRKKTVTPRANS